MVHPVIAGGARTPFGRLQGSLKSLAASDLGGVAIRGALDKTGLDPASIDYVIMGQVLTAGCGQGPARQAAVAGGIGMDVPSITINKLCLSGLNSISLAATLVKSGECEVVVAGGQESMSQAPHLLPGSRNGYKYGDAALKDSMAYDGLWDVFTDQPMGALTEEANTGEREFDRRAQDEFAARSHNRAAAAWKDGLFADEVVPVTVPARRGDDVEVATDEGIRSDASADSMAKLRPAFSKNGTVTAGNASQISDGAAAVIVTSREKADELGLDVLADIGAHGAVAGPDSTLQSQPANALGDALSKERMSAGDLDVIEINEAFAAVGLASTKALGADPDIVNVKGGAIAIGHPIGASGARLALTLAHELRRTGKSVGAASLCGGGGQGDALILRSPQT